jgi:hypothetical protein
MSALNFTRSALLVLAISAAAFGVADLAPEKRIPC